VRSPHELPSQRPRRTTLRASPLAVPEEASSPRLLVEPSSRPTGEPQYDSRRPACVTCRPVRGGRPAPGASLEVSSSLQRLRAAASTPVRPEGLSDRGVACRFVPSSPFLRPRRFAPPSAPARVSPRNAPGIRLHPSGCPDSRGSRRLRRSLPSWRCRMALPLAVALACTIRCTFRGLLHAVGRSPRPSRPSSPAVGFPPAGTRLPWVFWVGP